MEDRSTDNSAVTKTSSPRVSRNLESREFEGRIVNERPPIVFGGGSRFNLPPNLLKRFKNDGYVLSFVVYSSGNVDQKENYYNAIDRGYDPVASNEAPELRRRVELSPFGAREEGDQLIRVGGQTLMKRRVEDQEAEDKYYDSENSRQEYMMNLYRSGQYDPRRPIPFPLDERRRRHG